jgi:hypothetical protein
LFKLLAKDTEFYWNDECQHAFDVLKENISSAPVLRGTNWTLPFHISSDALDSYIGVVLGQKENLLTYAIYFIRKDLTLTELNYTVTEKEFLAVVYAINKVRNYIIEYEVFIHTDHSSIRYLMKKPITNGRITKWLLLLQEFNITIVDKPSKENQVADFLFRLDNKGENILIDESFPDENLFAISTNSPWFADIANYLTTKSFHLTFHPRKRKGLLK